ncbi:hypothetical protein [Kluyvera ascorbata]|uniref:hypothetical protein n=1 Tax=Kluyvera ascorbata TaxID=51288 RepID=UPI0039F694A2
MTALNKQALRNTANRDWFESWFKSEFHPDKTGPYIKDQLFFAVQAARKPLLDELEAAEKRIAELEARTPYGYLRQCDGQIQISIGSEQPHNRSGGYATPWFAIYTAAGIGVKGE